MSCCVGSRDSFGVGSDLSTVKSRWKATGGRWRRRRSGEHRSHMMGQGPWWKHAEHRSREWPWRGGQVTEAGIDASGCVLWRWQVHKPPGSFLQPTRIALCSKVYAGDCVAAGNTGRRKTHPPEMTQRKSSKMLFLIIAYLLVLVPGGQGSWPSSLIPYKKPVIFGPK